MSSLSVVEPKITIANHVINMVDGLYSLNDLHKASGGEDKHRPTYFMRNEETKALIAEINNENSDVQNRTSVKNKAFRVIRGNFSNGIKQGTYVCKELVYRYGMWIDAKFALLVIRTFDALVTRTDSKQRECLVSACDKLAVGNTLRSDVYKAIASHFGYEKVTQIPTPLLPEAVAYVYEQLLARQKGGSTNQDYQSSLRLLGQSKVEDINHAVKVAEKHLCSLEHAMKSLDCALTVIKERNATNGSVFQSLKAGEVARLR